MREKSFRYNEVKKNEMSNERPSRLEDLPNEVWLEVFSYLDWINLFMAFYGIKKRINQLLTSINSLELYSSYLLYQYNSICILFQVNFVLNMFDKKKRDE